MTLLLIELVLPLLIGIISSVLFWKSGPHPARPLLFAAALATALLPLSVVFVQLWAMFLIGDDHLASLWFKRVLQGVIVLPAGLALVGALLELWPAQPQWGQHRKLRIVGAGLLVGFAVLCSVIALKGEL